MEAAEARRLISQLSEDLNWLEDHCRRQPEMARQSSQLRIAAAEVRNILGPYLDEQPPNPLHIVVVGGAGTGKSTIVNFLTGGPNAEANPQAGFTRHPVAYVTSTHQLNWTSHLGFLGTLQRQAQPGPSNLDQDVYQVRRVTSMRDEFGVLGDCVIWDCPDMTTWAASGYVPRLMEVSGLADVIVYVASDERYNDEVPTQFLQLLVQAGKPIIVVLTKMNDNQAEPLVNHFRTEVLGRIPKPDRGPPVPVLAVPYLTPDQLKEPVKGAGKYRIPLLNQIAVLLDPAKTARERSVNQTLRFLSTASDSLLDVARQDLAALDAWRVAVQTGQIEFDNRYRREYLNNEGFRKFDDARERLMELIELPGAGKLVTGLFWVLRTPYRLLRNAMGKALARPETVNLPEHQVLDSAVRAWLDGLRAEAIRKADSHALWRHLANGFNSGLAEIMLERFEESERRFQLGSTDEIEANSSAITLGLLSNPQSLGSLRIFKVLLDFLAIGLALWVGNFGWPSIIWAMLFVSLEHQIVELVVRQYVETRREQTRSRKQLMITQYLSAPMTDWLTQWPSTGGSTYERLTMALRRVPATIRQIAELIVKRQQPPAPAPAATPPVAVAGGTP